MLVRHPFRALRQKIMDRERIAICLLHEVGNEAKQISGVREIKIARIRLANLFEQMLDHTTQLLAKIKFGSTKTLNKKQESGTIRRLRLARGN